jgi:hypothetical protein
MKQTENRQIRLRLEWDRYPGWDQLLDVKLLPEATDDELENTDGLVCRTEEDAVEIGHGVDTEFFHDHTPFSPGLPDSVSVVCD